MADEPLYKIQNYPGQQYKVLIDNLIPFEPPLGMQQIFTAIPERRFDWLRDEKGMRPPHYGSEQMDAGMARRFTELQPGRMQRGIKIPDDRDGSGKIDLTPDLWIHMSRVHQVVDGYIKDIEDKNNPDQKPKSHGENWWYFDKPLEHMEEAIRQSKMTGPELAKYIAKTGKSPIPRPSGDCDEAAITKLLKVKDFIRDYNAKRPKGSPPLPVNAVSLMLVIDGGGEGHLITVVNTDRGAFALDNKFEDIMPVQELEETFGYTLISMQSQLVDNAWSGLKLVWSSDVPREIQPKLKQYTGSPFSATVKIPQNIKTDGAKVDVTELGGLGRPSDVKSDQPSKQDAPKLP